MYCSQCGKEMRDTANFCPSCGAKVMKAQPQESAEAPISFPGKDADSPSAEPSPADDLEAAVAETRRRSRRKVPLVLIVALAMALATGVAYAARYVYVNVWMPYQQQLQEQQAQKNAAPQSEEESEQAKTAYEKIISEYRQAIKDWQATDGEVYDDLETRYPDVNSELMLYDFGDSPERALYAIVDITGDGTPELLIGRDPSCVPSTAYGPCATVGIFTLQNGKPLQIYCGWMRGNAIICQDGVIAIYNEIDGGSTSLRYARIKASSLTETDKIIDGSSATDKENFEIIESIEYGLFVDEADTIIWTKPDGSTELFSKPQGLDSPILFETETFSSLVNEITPRYPEADIDWQPLMES